MSDAYWENKKQEVLAVETEIKRGALFISWLTT